MVASPYANTTPYNVIVDALQDSGVSGQGQTPTAFDINKTFRIMNRMIAQWRRKRWLVYHLLDVALVSTGAQSYSIGPGGDFDVVRPDRLEDGNFLRFLNQGETQRVDYPLRLVQSREDYNRIVLKAMGTFPEVIFYDAAYPLGYIYPWPVPQASIYEIHLLLKEVLPIFTALNQSLSLPEEYEGAIYSNLVQRVRVAYRLPSDPQIDGLAKDGLNVLRGANTQIATLQMPDVLVGRQRPYNVYSDT